MIEWFYKISNNRHPVCSKFPLRFANFAYQLFVSLAEYRSRRWPNRLFASLPAKNLGH
jgi:hypothetical protein